MPSLALAAPSPPAADAGKTLAEVGGNAADVAVGAAAVAMLVEPGVCAPGAGGFATVAPPDGSPIVFDGYLAAPLRPQTDAVGETVTMAYGGGVSTLVGPASVAVPGAWAALGAAHARFGRLPWREVLGPAIEVARSGFPLGRTSRYYLGYSGEAIFSADPASRSALYPDGVLLAEGAPVRLDGLARSLESIAEYGADDLYRGELGRQIATDLARRGASLTHQDFLRYRVVEREATTFRLADWSLATNPPPAVGGVALAAMLETVGASHASATAWIEAQRRVFQWRRDVADHAGDRVVEGLAFLAALTSPSTVHLSAVDATGLAAAVTLSAGYGSGVIPTGTGMWMNNGLGEFELVGTEPSRLESGGRLNSNMAPTVARGPGGATLAVGSPGADRITTALAQTLHHLIVEGDDLVTALARPRLHVDVRGEGPRVFVEPGIDAPTGIGDVVAYDRLHMYFGGVGAAMRTGDGDVLAAADPRRDGVAVVVA